MKKYIKSIGALTVICAVMAIILAITNSITAPIIEKNEAAAANEALLVVMPDGEGFEPVDISAYELPSTVTAAYKESAGGCVVQLLTSGYGPNMVIMCGVNAEGAVTGAVCLSSGETLGYEKTYGENMVGKTAEDIDTVDTISGATLTTTGYKNAVKDAINAAVIIGGGSVDLRSEEEVLRDNLSNALPSANGEFIEVFVTEKLANPAKVYASANGTGYVFVVGEEFIAVDNTATVLTQGATVDVSEDAKLIIASAVTEIDISGYEMPKQVKKAYKTNSGNYVFELGANGYGINGDQYTLSNEQIEIKVSATAEGEIISCVTVKQSESKNIGDACAKPEFYTQFNGKTTENYEDIDAISGATITTKGYTVAVSKVFEAINILEGEA
jgi:electron transport complex protein RnfG